MSYKVNAFPSRDMVSKKLSVLYESNCECNGPLITNCY